MAATARRRYQVRVGGKHYDLTGAIFDLLSQKSFRLAFPVKWDEQRRVDGLMEKGLVEASTTTSKSATYKRTELGTEVVKAIEAKKVKGKKATNRTTKKEGA